MDQNPEDYLHQIEDIIRNSDQKDALEGARSFGNLTAVFFLSICEKGLTREEALSLSQSYLMELFHFGQNNGS